MGWEGSIQFNLINAFGQRQDFPQLFGFYLGRRRGRYLLEYAPSFAEGLLYDYRNYSINERLPLEFLEIYEEAARAPHGTALGYRWAGNNTIRPMLKQPGQADRDCEIRDNPQLAVMQQGILDFAGRYLEVIRATGYGSQQIKPFVLATAARFVCLPRKNEIRGIIRNFSHAADFDVRSSFELGARSSRRCIWAIGKNSKGPFGDKEVCRRRAELWRGWPQLAECQCLVHGEKLVMQESITKPVADQPAEEMHNAPAAARAAMYLRGLDRFGVQAGDGALPKAQLRFFRRLRLELEASLEHFEKSAAGWSENVDDFESHIELDWLCNQCEYWMGPADCLDVSRIFKKCAEMDCRAAAMTAWECAAVRSLAQTTSFLVKAKSNPLILWPRPIRVCRWAIGNSREVFRLRLFDLSRAIRRFRIWLKMVLLRFC